MLRRDSSLARNPDRNNCAGEKSWQLLFENSRHFNGATTCIDHGTDVSHGGHRSLLEIRSSRHRDQIPALQQWHVRPRQSKAYLKRRVANHAKQLVADRDVLTKSDIALRHNSVERCNQFFLLELKVEGLQVSLCTEHLFALPFYFVLACGYGIAGVVIGLL